MKPEADITILPTVDSTNIYAMQQVHAHMAKDGQVYFALEQTAGRGQRGKQWLSAPGTNIMMSMVFDVDGLPTNASSRSIWPWPLPVMIIINLLPEMKCLSNGLMISTGVTERQGNTGRKPDTIRDVDLVHRRHRPQHQPNPV